MIKNLIFDFSDTLCRFGAFDWLRGMADEEQALRIHFAHFRLPEWPCYDRGEISTEAFREKYIAALDECDREIGGIYCDGWYHHHIMIDGIPELLAELKAKGYKIYLLSDYPEIFEYNWEKFADFFKIFDGRCVSYELGARKRERKPFGLLLDRFGLKAEECYFVDDLDLNVEAALECGFSAHQFTTTECLREELNKLGIL